MNDNVLGLNCPKTGDYDVDASENAGSPVEFKVYYEVRIDGCTYLNSLTCSNIDDAKRTAEKCFDDAKRTAEKCFYYQGVRWVTMLSTDAQGKSMSYIYHV